MQKKIAILAMITILVLAAFVLVYFVYPRQTQSKRYQSSYFDLFDTYTELIVYAADEAQAQAMIAVAKDELTVCHQLFDIYNDYDGINNLKTINDNAGLAPVQVDERIIDLLVFSKEMYQKTDGQMNVAMGSVLALWHDKRTAGLADPDNAELPDMEALTEAAQHMDIENLIIDEQAMTVYLADPLMQLDVGAVAKGYATERTAQLMADAGAQSALLSVGGNVRAIGQRADGTAWQVGVQNPDLDADETYIATVALLNSSMVTSGSYQRYYTVDGVRYHHIIDPNTLMPADYAQSVTILAENSGIADALSTALFTVSVEQGKKILQQFDNVQALWVIQDGEIIRTDGFTTE